MKELADILERLCKTQDEIEEFFKPLLQNQKLFIRVGHGSYSYCYRMVGTNYVVKLGSCKDFRHIRRLMQVPNIWDIMPRVYYIHPSDNFLICEYVESHEAERIERNEFIQITKSIRHIAEKFCDNVYDLHEGNVMRIKGRCFVVDYGCFRMD